jgi:hypothetical protein
MHTSITPEIQIPVDNTLEYRAVLEDIEKKIDQGEKEPLGVSLDDEVEKKF